MAAQPDCRFLIFDFRLVTGIDSSATHSFAQIKQAAAAYGARIVLVNLTPELERAFRTAVSFPTTSSSRPISIARWNPASRDHRSASHRSRRRAIVAGLAVRCAWAAPQYADRLTDYCRRLEVPAGDIIARQGDAAASMHFILEGRVGIVVDLGEGRTMRVRSLGRHTTIGEMGLITGRPRSATIAAEADSVLYELSAEAYERIKRDEPALSQALARLCRFGDVGAAEFRQPRGRRAAALRRAKR